MASLSTDIEHAVTKALQPFQDLNDMLSMRTSAQFHESVFGLLFIDDHTVVLHFDIGLVRNTSFFRDFFVTSSSDTKFSRIGVTRSMSSHFVEKISSPFRYRGLQGSSHFVLSVWMESGIVSSRIAGPGATWWDGLLELVSGGF